MEKRLTRHGKGLPAFRLKVFRKPLLLLVSLSLATVLTGYRSDNVHGEIVCFGDSITYGAGVNGESWVWYLSKEHPDLQVVNAGRSGRKTANRQELLPVLEQHAHAAYYLLFLGVNDLKNGTDSMVNVCVTNMQWMIETIRGVNKDAQIILLAPTDINLKTMSTLNRQKNYNRQTKTALHHLERQYRQLAGRMHTGFISLLHAVSKSNYLDGLHPDGKGQEQIAALVWKRLDKLLSCCRASLKTDYF